MPEIQQDGLSFTLTGRDLWEKLDEISKAVGATAGLPKTVEDHEVRIRALERKVFIASGFAAAIGAGLGTTLSRLIGG